MFRYGIAIGAVALATWVRLLLNPGLGSLSPFSVFVFAILIAARYGGLRPALAAVALSLLSVDYFVIAPRGGAPELVLLLVYLGVGISTAVLGGSMRSANLVESRTLRETRETLARTEERLALTLKSTGVSVWNWNMLEDTIHGDENAAAQFGISPSQFPRNIAEFAAFVHPDDRERVQAEITVSIEQGHPYDTRFRTIWPDGSTHLLSTRGKVYRDHLEKPFQFTGVCMDVTDRWQAEDKLRATTEKLAAEARFRELLEAAPDAVVVVNCDGVIVLVNAQAETLFGYARQEMLGQKLEILVPHRFRGVHALHQQAYSQRPYMRQRGAHLGLYALRKDGTELPVEIALSPLETHDGKLVYSTIRDITERRLAERTLEQLASIVDYSDDAIIGKTLDGTISSWNRGAERLYGYPAEEVLGKPISILLPPGCEDELPSIIARLKRGEVVRQEVVRRRKDGTLIDVALTVSPIKGALGEITAASAIARDISQRKKSQQEILQLNKRLEQTAAEAQAANLAKSTFLSTMSHEIRTPMNAILGYAQLMARDPALSADAKANLKIIGRSGEHLLALINDILDMSKIEAGRVELHPATFNLPRLLDDLAAMFRLRAQAKALEFELLTDGESVPYVVADEGKTRQVLINLLGNAVKFTELGRVTLEVSVNTRTAGQLWLSAAIRDSGPGISAGDQARLFEPFCQPKGDLNTQQGTGLGLAISRKYARLMGGDITVASAPGGGSTFLFEIPIGRGDAGIVKKSSGRGRIMGIRPGQEPPKILVTDDHAENRSWLVKLLGSLGFRVREAENGAAAVAVSEEWQPQLIVMDVHMPGMSGLEATRRIKASERGRKTIVIALTASAMQEDRRTVEQSGADAFLSKPCAENDLLEEIAVHLGVVYDYEQAVESEDFAGAPMGLDPDSLGTIPLDILQQLREATLSGNRRALNKLIAQMKAADKARPVQALQDLVDRYEYDALTHLLEAACQR
ncbi:MAG TPA: PAS domain S-box protein [Bryobacteraceae bacterium]|nr:PAS domain S-box protein [Bryobacteraceae bacterium]